MLSDFFEPFERLAEVGEPDGLGGSALHLQENGTLLAGIRALRASEIEVALRLGLRGTFRVTTGPEVSLRRGEVLRRLRDGRLYRVTGNAADFAAPDAACVRQRYVTAEVIA